MPGPYVQLKESTLPQNNIKSTTSTSTDSVNLVKLCLKLWGAFVMVVNVRKKNGWEDRKNFDAEQKTFILAKGFKVVEFWGVFGGNKLNKKRIPEKGCGETSNIANFWLNIKSCNRSKTMLSLVLFNVTCQFPTVC